MSCCNSSYNKKKKPANNTVGVHICEGECIQLFAEACPGSTFKWEPSDYLSADNVPNPVASPLETTCYTVLIKNAGKKFECRTSFVVNVHPSPALECPDKPLTLCMGQKLPVGASLAKGSACSDTLTFEWDPVLGLDDPHALNPNAVWAAFPCPDPDATTKEKIIYFDSFNRAPELLNNSIPDIVDSSVANARWSVMALNGNLHKAQVFQNQALFQGNGFAGLMPDFVAALPFNPLPNRVYTLCADVDTADFSFQSVNSLAYLAFGNGTTAVQGLVQQDREAPDGTELFTVVDETVTAIDAYPIGYVSNGKMQVVLDTTPDANGMWSLSLFYGNNNGPLRPILEPTAVQVGGIDNVLIMTDADAVQVNDFKLTCAERSDVQKFFYTLTATSPEGCVDQKEYCVVVHQDMPPVPCINAYRVAEFNVYNDPDGPDGLRNQDRVGELANAPATALLTDRFEKVLGTDPNNAASPSVGVLDFPAAGTIFQDASLEQKVFSKQKPLDRHFISFREKDNKRKPIYICEGEAIALCGGLAVDCRQLSMCLCDESDVNDIPAADLGDTPAEQAAERERLKKVLSGLIYKWSVVGGGSLGDDPFTGEPVDPKKQCILVQPEHSTIYQLEIEDSCTGCKAQMDAFFSVVVKKLPKLRLKEPTKLAEPNKIFVCRPRDNYKHLVLKECPLVYYQFNERTDQASSPVTPAGVKARDCSVLKDKHKKANDGTYVGTVLREQPSKSPSLGCAISLQNSGDYVFAPQYGTGLTQVSIELWFKVANNSTGERVLYETGSFSSVGDTGLQVRLSNLGRVALKYDGKDNVQTATGFNDGEWHHIVIVIDVDSPRQIIYVDGSVGAMNTNALTATQVDLTMGRIGQSQSGSNQFVGDLDEFAVYPAVLDADAVAEHFRAGCRGTSEDNPPPCVSVCVAAEPPVGRGGSYEWYGRWEDRESALRDAPSLTPCDYFLKDPLEDRVDAPTTNFAQKIDLDKLYADFDKKQDDGGIKAYNYVYCVEVCCPANPRDPSGGACPAVHCFQVYASNDVAPSADIKYVPGTGALDPDTCEPAEKVGPVKVGRNEVCIVCDNLPTQFCTDNEAKELKHLEFEWHPPQYFDDPTSPYPTLYVNGFDDAEDRVPPLESGDKVSVKVHSLKTHCHSEGECLLEVRPTPCAEIGHDKDKLFGCVSEASKDTLVVKPCLHPKTPVTIDDYCFIVEKVWAKCALTKDDFEIKESANAGGTVFTFCIKALTGDNAQCKVGMHRVTVVPQAFGFHDDTVSIESPSIEVNGCSGPPLTFDVCILPKSDLGLIKLCFNGCDAFQLLNIDYEPFFPAKAFNLQEDFEWKWLSECPPTSVSDISPSVVVDAPIPIVNPHDPHPIITLQTLMANAGEKCGVFCLWLEATHKQSLCKFNLDVVVTVSDKAAKLEPKVSYVCKKSGRAIVTNVNGMPNLPTEWTIEPLCNDPKAESRISIGPKPGNHSATVSQGLKNCTYELVARVKDVASENTDCECVCSTDNAFVHFVKGEPETPSPALHFSLEWYRLIESTPDGDNADSGTYVMCVPLKGLRGDLSFKESKTHPLTLDNNDPDVKKALVYDAEEESLYIFVKLPEGRQTIAYEFVITWEAFFVCAPKKEAIGGKFHISAPNNPETFRKAKDALVFTNLPETPCLAHESD